MTNVLLLHGTGETPQSFWYPWFAAALPSDRYSVAIPHLPTINTEPPEATIARLHEQYHDKPDIIVGHSAGGPLALALLQGGLIVEKTVSVAGFHRELPQPGNNPVLLPSYDWETITHNGGDITYINSVNDPWGCNDVQGREMFDHTGGTLIIRKEGHFGSNTHNQPYPTFPLLRAVIIS